MRLFVWVLFLAFCLTIILGFLKATGIITWSLWLITSPVWSAWLAALFCIGYQLSVISGKTLLSDNSKKTDIC